jgi:hypothetical protein
LISDDGLLLFDYLSISPEQLTLLSYNQYHSMISTILKGRRRMEDDVLPRFKHAILNAQQFEKIRGLAIFFYATIE